MSAVNSRMIGEALASFDPLWSDMRNQAEEIMRAEPALASFVYATDLNHERL